MRPVVVHRSRPRGREPASAGEAMARTTHVLICNWRDTRNPEGGGSEVYVEQMAAGLVERGFEVTIACAAHDHAPRREVRDGIRFERRGSKLDVYARTALALLLRRYGRVDVVVDVQNGLPFLTRWVTRAPVVLLVHHVHREQWPVVYPGLIGRIGWWIESRLSPRVYRRSRYVAVSRSTRDELVDLGVDRSAISIIHNGTEPTPMLSAAESARTDDPTLCVLGRLVPHKQVEHAIDAVADLAERHPRLSLDIVGSGWWEDELRAHAEARGVSERVRFHGFVDDRTKHHLVARAWVMALPSLKEGWGLVVGEAGAHGTPTVAYASAGGTAESIHHKDSGVLVDHPHELTEAIDQILSDREWRSHLGEGARAMSQSFSWEASRSEFAQVIARALDSR